jgi:hypothetical protein
LGWPGDIAAQFPPQLRSGATDRQIQASDTADPRRLRCDRPGVSPPSNALLATRPHPSRNRGPILFTTSPIAGYRSPGEQPRRATPEIRPSRQDPRARAGCNGHQGNTLVNLSRSTVAECAGAELVNATVVVAVAGLVATTTVGIASPYIQGRVAARNAERARQFDLRTAALADAMSYAHRLGHYTEMLTDSSPLRVEYKRPREEDVVAIGAMLYLYAPKRVRETWDSVTEADRQLRWLVDHEAQPVVGAGVILPNDEEILVNVNLGLQKLVRELQSAARSRDD